MTGTRRGPGRLAAERIAELVARDQRLARFTRLRQSGLPVAEAGVRLGMTPAAARRYERTRKRQARAEATR